VYDDEGRLRYASSVGTGWDSMLAAAVLRNMENLELPASPFDPDFAPTKGDGANAPLVANDGLSRLRSPR